MLSSCWNKCLTFLEQFSARFIKKEPLLESDPKAFNWLHRDFVLLQLMKERWKQWQTNKFKLPAALVSLFALSSHRKCLLCPFIPPFYMPGMRYFIYCSSGTAPLLSDREEIIFPIKNAASSSFFFWFKSQLIYCSWVIRLKGLDSS